MHLYDSFILNHNQNCNYVTIFRQHLLLYIYQTQTNVKKKLLQPNLRTSHLWAYFIYFRKYLVKKIFLGNH